MVGKKYFYENMQVMAKALDNDPETKDRYEKARRGGKEWLCFSRWIAKDRTPMERSGSGGIPRFAHLVVRLYRHHICPPV